eukprot:1694015-Pyramimonas_sp.AAC.2
MNTTEKREPTESKPIEQQREPTTHRPTENTFIKPTYRVIGRSESYNLPINSFTSTIAAAVVVVLVSSRVHASSVDATATASHPDAS